MLETADQHTGNSVRQMISTKNQTHNYNITRWQWDMSLTFGIKLVHMYDCCLVTLIQVGEPNTSCACSGVATLPVPIAQMGSYAITTLAQQLIFAAIFQSLLPPTSLQRYWRYKSLYWSVDTWHLKQTIIFLQLSQVLAWWNAGKSYSVLRITCNSLCLPGDNIRCLISLSFLQRFTNA